MTKCPTCYREEDQEKKIERIGNHYLQVAMKHSEWRDIMSILFEKLESFSSEEVILLDKLKCKLDDAAFQDAMEG